jgi:hypothetical protein
LGFESLTADGDTLLMFYVKHACPPAIRKVEFLLSTCENNSHMNKQGETILDIAFKKLGQDRLAIA